MLALVHPYNPSPDVPHRPAPSTASTSRPRQQQTRKQTSSSLPPSVPSSSRTSAAVLRPNLQLPPHQPPLHPTSPPKPPRASTPTPPIASEPASVFDIHSYPSTELLRLLAALLTQIAATNDKLEALSPTGSSTSEHPSTTPTRTSLSSLTEDDAPIWRTLTTASRTAISTPSSTLTFHARNIPTITLEAYFLRILKYCPTTNEVFLSLLVYFDRMSKLSADATGQTFVIDSYNIHRLVIAGVTVASKFFSDVFYTNSRYAKVGGLPLAELNQLELQFLLLNDFRLVISRDEMQRYAEQLIVFSNPDEMSLAPSPILPSPHPTPSSASSYSSSPSSGAMGGITAPMQAMGAIDAYGGLIHGAESESSGSSRSAQVQYLQPGASAAFEYFPATSSSSTSHRNNSNRTPNAMPQYDGDETETETDGGETTDDEPTIRPTHSSADSSSDTRSLCGSINSSSGAEDTGDEGDDEFGDDDRDGANDAMDIENEVKGTRGDRTPERVTRGRDGERTPERRFMGGSDRRMGSP